MITLQLPVFGEDVQAPESTRTWTLARPAVLEAVPLTVALPATTAPDAGLVMVKVGGVLLKVSATDVVDA